MKSEGLDDTMRLDDQVGMSEEMETEIQGEEACYLRVLILKAVTPRVQKLLAHSTYYPSTDYDHQNRLP